MDLPPIQLLYAFEAAARCGSFKRAAAELHVTPSAVSQQVAALEEHLATPLFHRLPRAVQLSAAGAAFFRVAADTLDCYRRGAGAFVAARTRQPLRVSMQPFVAYEIAIPQLHTLRRAHPDLDLRLETSSGLADVAGGEVDAAVRFGRGPWPGLAATRLTRVTAGLVCAPALLDGRGALRTAALRDGQLIIVPSAKVRVRAMLEANGLGALLPPRDLILDSFLATMRAAEQGLGVAVGLFPLAEPWLRLGRLVAPLPTRFPLSESYQLVCRKAERGRPEIVALRRWLQAQFAALASTTRGAS
ncbi:MAG: LysR substrate-binding domain-containing protein [Kofleriaceae bacterium]